MGQLQGGILISLDSPVKYKKTGTTENSVEMWVAVTSVKLWP